MFGLMNYMVTRRTHQIAIRVVFGVTPTDVSTLLGVAAALFIPNAVE
jgi:hypothetical protein